jgi:CubicO group peptidase (beta-lactamase class C family)
LAAVGVGGGRTSAQPADLAAQAEAVLQAAYPADGPGAAVIITKGGRTLYAGGRGLADVETRRPITPDSTFRLGSITKQFTAVAVLQLVQNGRISLDDPVSRFLPSYPGPGGAATVRQLLNHTSGVPSYNEIPGWLVEANTRRPHTTAELTAVFRDLPLRTSPGQTWAYSNSGYVLLGGILEAVTRKPWHEVVAQRIARPLELKTVGYGARREASPAMVRGYTIGADGAVQPARPTHMSVPHAAAGLVGSVRDLARWTDALHHGRAIGPALYARMIAPTALPGERSHPYGFGLALGEVRGRKVVRHDGRIAGFNNESLYIPAEDVVVAVLTNSDSPATSPALVGRRLAALAVGEPYRLFTRAAVDVQTLAPLFGVYEGGAPGVSRRFLARDGRLFIARAGAAEREVFSAGNNQFFYPDSFTWFRIERRGAAAPVMHLHQDGAAEAEASTRTRRQP